MINCFEFERNIRKCVFAGLYRIRPNDRTVRLRFVVFVVYLFIFFFFKITGENVVEYLLKKKKKEHALKEYHQRISWGVYLMMHMWYVFWLSL